METSSSDIDLSTPVAPEAESIDGASNADAWTQHVAEQSMLVVVDPKARQREAASPEGARAADVDQTTRKRVPETNTNSQDTAFETLLSEQPWNRVSPGSGELREAIAKSRPAGRELPANGRETPGRADYGCRETASP